MARTDVFGLSELAVILVVVVLVLAVKKLPELTRSAGKSARILKAEAKALKEDHPASSSQVIPGETVPPKQEPKPTPQ